MFKTTEIKEYWTNCSRSLEEYYHSLVQFNFKYAGENVNDLLIKIQEFEASSGSKQVDAFLNDIFILKTYLELLKKYAEFWSQICDGVFPQSWDTLQDVLDLLRLINRFTEFSKTLTFKFLEKQVQALEILYPYRIFASIEVIYGRTECSICKKSIDSFDCPHIAGELYRGRMAYGIVEGVKEVLSVSLVEHPANKRCKIEAFEGRSPNFTCVEYLSKSVKDKRHNPLTISHTELKTKKIKVSTFSKIGINELCPCGGGKKFKQCCINKDFVSKPHIDIIVSNQELISSNDIINLTPTFL